MDFVVKQLLCTEAVMLSDVLCSCGQRHKGEEECTTSTRIVFPYRGVYIRHVGSKDAVAEANQALFFNEGEEYRISHPLQGGDACLSMTIDEGILRELTPKSQLRGGATLAFAAQRRRIDPRAQVLVTLLRHGLGQNAIETLEAETLSLTLMRRVLGEHTSHGASASWGLQKLVDRAKLVISSNLSRRWTLVDIAREVGVSPVYLTQAFRQVEQIPLYRYQLRLRLARALDLLGDYEDITALGLELGFSSHSHFTAAFRQAYGRTPAEFRRSARRR
ncbi:helix-turn-helix transcriptional regulator [Aestuariivirga sp.]|uniref:helix-turn-helix transcriptional regulator n=1 Tax=Aestuariivirga sp. TaxID=2650926 RepID=UPI003BAD429D